MKIKEFDLIDKIEKLFKVPSPYVELGIGDDGAIINIPAGYRIVLSTDSMVENVHFNIKYMSPEDIGKRLLMVNISDIAAMGAHPRYILLSMIIPSQAEESVILNILESLKKQCESWNVYLIGGNISQGKELSFTITIVGILEGMATTRDGGCAGDKIYLTGEIGGAVLGRMILEKGLIKEENRILIDKYVQPNPPVKLITSLKILAHTAIDISDGFIKDLKHILSRSKCGAKIHLGNLPLPQSYNNYYNLFNKDDRWAAALYGGDDYELIITVPKEFSNSFVVESRILGRDVFEIGELTNNPDQIEFILPSGELYTPQLNGWDHSSGYCK